MNVKATGPVNTGEPVGSTVRSSVPVSVIRIERTGFPVGSFPCRAPVPEICEHLLCGEATSRGKPAWRTPSLGSSRSLAQDFVLDAEIAESGGADLVQVLDQMLALGRLEPLAVGA